QFTKAQGTDLSAREVSKISAQIRKLIRESFTPQPVELPSDFPFSGFKSLVGGSKQVVALPLQLSGGGSPSGGIQGVNNLFIGSSGFAVAVSKAYVNVLLGPLFDSVKHAITKYKHKIKVTLGIPPYTYTATIATLTLQLRSGPSLAWKSG